MLVEQSIFFDGIDGISHFWQARGMKPEQCRAARGLLDWSQQDLAEKAGVGIVTVRQLEAGANEPRRATLDVIRRAFETAGVEFIDENGGGAGVRLKRQSKKRT
jgi:transcriptional regulator with XRE-family HTH domain